MKYITTPLTTFFRFVKPIIFCPIPLEMDYLTSCCHLLYISYRTLSIVHNSIFPIKRLPFHLPQRNFARRGIAQMLAKRPKEMAETPKISCEDRSEHCLETVNYKRSGEVSLESCSKKIKLLYTDDQETITSVKNQESINITLTSETTIITEDQGKNKKKKKKRKLKADKNSSLLESSIEKEERKYPNYYIAVAISDPEICAAVERIQQSLSLQDVRLKQIMLPVDTLHVTLMVLTLDEETYTGAKKALNNAHEEINNSMCEKPLNLEFCGVGHFNHRVLYAKMCRNESFERFIAFMELIKLHLGKENVLTSVKEEEFTPHLTMGKLRMASKLHRSIKKINPVFYETFKNQYFGSQIVDGFRLIKMDGRRDPVTGRPFTDEFLFQKDK